MSPDAAPEALARQTIDRLLTAAGWSVQDYKSYNPSAAHGIALREVPLKSGRCDYLLIVDRKPIGVVEAKKAGTTLSGIAEQSAHYAANLPAFFKMEQKQLAFLYESTGAETFFRDSRDPESRSRQVFGFHKPETLAQWAAEPATLRARLRKFPPLVTVGMRDCQIEAITNLEKSLAADKPHVGDELRPGDLLIIRTNGSRNLIGRGSVVREGFDRVHAFASYLIRFRIVPIPELLGWVATIWHSSWVRRWVEQRAATSAGQHNISMSVLEMLPIPLPPTPNDFPSRRIKVMPALTISRKLRFDMQNDIVGRGQHQGRPVGSRLDRQRTCT